MEDPGWRLCVSCAANQGLVLSVLTPIDWERFTTDLKPSGYPPES